LSPLHALADFAIQLNDANRDEDGGSMSQPDLNRSPNDAVLPSAAHFASLSEQISGIMPFGFDVDVQPDHGARPSRRHGAFFERLREQQRAFETVATASASSGHGNVMTGSVVYAPHRLGHDQYQHELPVSDGFAIRAGRVNGRVRADSHVDALPDHGARPEGRHLSFFERRRESQRTAAAAAAAAGVQVDAGAAADGLAALLPHAAAAAGVQVDAGAAADGLAALLPHAAAAADGDGNVPRILPMALFRFASRVYVAMGNALPELKEFEPHILAGINCPRPICSLSPGDLTLATWECAESMPDGDARMRTFIFLGIVRAFKRMDQNFLIPANNHMVLGLYFPDGGAAPRPLLIFSASRSGERVKHFHSQFKREDRWSTFATELTDAQTGLTARLCTKPHTRVSNDVAPFGGLVSMALFLSNRALGRVQLPANERQSARASLLASCDIMKRHAVLISHCVAADQDPNLDLRNQISQDTAAVAVIDAAPVVSAADAQRRTALHAKNKMNKEVLHRSGRLPDEATPDLMALVNAKLRSLQRSTTVRSAGRDDVEDRVPEGPVADVELVDFLNTVDNNTFSQNLAYIMQDFRIVDTTPQGGQVQSARFIVQIDLDQWMSKFGHRDEAAEGVANPVAPATRTPLGIQVRQVSNASGASRPKSAAALGLGKPYSFSKLGALQLPNQGDCPCALFLAAQIADAQGELLHDEVGSSDGFVQKCKELALKAEQDHWMTGENRTAPLAVYHRARLMSTPLIQQDVIGPTKGRVPADKFIANLSAAISERFPSFTPCVELYNCKTLEMFSSPSYVRTRPQQ
jgi:hypothetical protein